MTQSVTQSESLPSVFLSEDEVYSVQMRSERVIFPGFALFSSLLRSFRKTFQEFYRSFGVNTTGGTEGLSTVPLHLVAAQRLFRGTQIPDFLRMSLGGSLGGHWGVIEGSLKMYDPCFGGDCFGK